MSDKRRFVNERADEVERTIREAFANVECPDRLRQKRDADSDNMERELKGKPWATLTIPELMRHRDALGMVDADAFRFFLPAFLVGSLDDTRPGYVEDLREATLFALGPHLSGHRTDPGREQRLRVRIASLDQRQTGEVRCYLAFVRGQVSHPKEFSALDPKGFWAHFDK